MNQKIEKTAKTQKGQIVKFWAENTDSELKTQYPVKYVKHPTLKMAYAILLNKDECNAVLGVNLPATMPAAAVFVEGDWKEFEREMLRERMAAKMAKLESMFPGLEALRAARADENRYHAQFERMMDDEQNDGVNPPKFVKVRYQDLAPKYSKAVAYLKAEGYSESSHYAKNGAGRTALSRLEAGENVEKVIAEMEAEWSKFCTENVD